VITGQVALSTAKDTALPLTLGNLTVTDPDNSYPTGFTLSVQAGSNYTVAGTTITPAASFVGTLTVPVTVNDGTATVRCSTWRWLFWTRQRGTGDHGPGRAAIHGV